jgi:hypothetical protein
MPGQFDRNRKAGSQQPEYDWEMKKTGQLQEYKF